MRKELTEVNVNMTKCEGRHTKGSDEVLFPGTSFFVTH